MEVKDMTGNYQEWLQKRAMEDTELNRMNYQYGCMMVMHSELKDVLVPAYVAVIADEMTLLKSLIDEKKKLK